MNNDTIPSAPSSSPPARRHSMSRMNLLPEDFRPGEYDVICGRGKKCYSHIGNDKFRQRVMGMLDEYSKARSKLDKSAVLNDVVEQVRIASPRGGFVKQEESGRWYEVGDFLAREKTSQAFRDCLHDSYKSSNVAKKKRRQEEQAKQSDKLQRFGKPDFFRMNRFPPSRGYSACGMKSQTSLEIFNQMNRLSEIREDETAFANGPSNPHRFSELNPTGSFNFGSDSVPSMGMMNSMSRRPMRSVSEMGSLTRFPGEEEESSFSMEEDKRGVQRSFSLPVSPDGSSPSAHMPEYGLGGSFNMNYNSSGNGFDQQENMHASLPNLNFSMNRTHSSESQPEDFSQGRMDEMHHSMPQMHYSEGRSQNSWSQPRARDDMSCHRLPALSREKNSHIKSFSRRSDLSKDMMSLDSMRESTISEEMSNPFEPIPLSPLQNKQEVDRDSMIQLIQDVTLMDEPVYSPTIRAPQSLAEHIDHGALLVSEHSISTDDMFL